MMDFPASPTVGQVFGNYSWDGEKWVQSAPIGSGVPEAPSDGLLYGRLNATWVPAAPLSSPALVTPTATTPAAGDSDTSIATTAFVQGELAAQSVVRYTAQTLTAPQQSQARSNIGIGVAASALIAPVGARLSYTFGAPAMTASVSAATAIHCVPHLNSLIPVWNGAQWDVLDIGTGINQTLSDATKSPAAVAANSLYDVFAWLDGSTPRISRGPAWTNATTRALALARQGGVFTNAAAITNGPLANRGTWLGTFLSNAAAQGDWKLGGAAAGGAPIALTLWNAYNRLEIAGNNRDTSSWAYGSNAWRAVDNSTNNSALLVLGATDDCIDAVYTSWFQTNLAYPAFVGIGVDSTTVHSGVAGTAVWTNTASEQTNSSATGRHSGFLVPGSHTVYAIEIAPLGSVFFGSSASLVSVGGLSLRGRF